jgi:multiple sugar transport system permease protein
MLRVADPPRRRMSRVRRQEILFGYAGLIPYLIGFLAFVAGPLIYSFWLSFNNYNILRPPRFIGLANFETLLNDPLFWQSLKVTATYSLVSVPLHVLVGYSLALLLNQ